MLRATPKTLKQAIRNGLNDSELDATDEQMIVVYRNIKDFISQKISQYVLDREVDIEDKMLELFKKLTRGE